MSTLLLLETCAINTSGDGTARPPALLGRIFNVRIWTHCILGRGTRPSPPLLSGSASLVDILEMMSRVKYGHTEQPALLDKLNFQS